MSFVFLLLTFLLFVELSKPKIFGFAAITSLIFMGASLLLPPSYDHAHFISRAASYASLEAALTDNALTIAPVSPMVFLFTSFLPISLDQSAILLNSIFLTLSLKNIIFAIDLQKNISIFKFLTIIISIFIFCPSLVQLMVSANKDLCIAFSLSTFFAGLLRLSARRKAVLPYLYGIVITISSYILISQLRPYFASMIIPALAIYIFLRQPFSKNLRFLLIIISLYFLCCTTLFYKWADIRGLVETYFGRATIWPLYYYDHPTFENVIYLPLLSIFALCCYPFSLLLTNSSISLANVIAGGWQTLMFIFGSTVFLLRFFSRKGERIEFVLIFFGIHCLIQPWGSPNTGALMRLTIIEYLFFTVLLWDTFSSFFKIKKQTFLHNYSSF